MSTIFDPTPPAAAINLPRILFVGTTDYRFPALLCGAVESTTDAPATFHGLERTPPDLIVLRSTSRTDDFDHKWRTVAKAGKIRLIDLGPFADSQALFVGVARETGIPLHHWVANDIWSTGIGEALLVEYDKWPKATAQRTAHVNAAFHRFGGDPTYNFSNKTLNMSRRRRKTRGRSDRFTACHVAVQRALKQFVAKNPQSQTTRTFGKTVLPAPTAPAAKQLPTPRVTTEKPTATPPVAQPPVVSPPPAPPLPESPPPAGALAAVRNRVAEILRLMPLIGIKAIEIGDGTWKLTRDEAQDLKAE